MKPELAERLAQAMLPETSYRNQMAVVCKYAVYDLVTGNFDFIPHIKRGYFF